MSTTRPLRVLYSFPHGVGRPGIGTTALQQVRALARAGADVTLVCATLHADVPDSVRVVEMLRLAGRRVPHRAFGSADRASVFHDVRAARLLGAGSYDVVHTWPGAALRTFDRARRIGVLTSREVPNTHTAHAMAEAGREAATVGVSLPARSSHHTDARRLRLEEREYAEADVLMVPSDHVADTFLERAVPEERLGRHHYGFDPERFHARGRTEVPDRPFTAVFVGRVEPRKGLHYALEAWKRATPAGGRFLIAGRVMPGYGDVLAPLLDQPGVELLDFVADVPALLRESDVLMLPSVEEGSALVTYEAQGSGCLPLVSEAAGALLPYGCCAALVHVPRDVDRLTAQLARLGGDADLRVALRREVVAWSVGITWDDAASRMLELWSDRRAAARLS